jgi:hypothetical protein
MDTFLSNPGIQGPKPEKPWIEGTTDRIRRINGQIRERELEQRRKEAEYAAGAPERDRLEAMRTPAVRIGEMNTLLSEARSLAEVLRGKSTEVRRLSDHLSQVKADQVMAELSDNDDELERAKIIVFARESIPLIQRKLEQARSEVIPVEEALRRNSDQLDTLATQLLRKLREVRFQELVEALEQAVKKVLPADRKTIEAIVENSQTFADYSVDIPAYGTPEEWAQVIADLQELSEPKAKKANRS